MSTRLLGSARRLFPAACLLLASCGLLDRSDELPSRRTVAKARTDNGLGWRALVVMAMRGTGGSASGRAALLRQDLEAAPGGLTDEWQARLAAYVQDAAADADGRPAVHAKAAEAFRRQPNPQNAYLLARLEPDPDRALELLRLAVAETDTLPQAQVQIWSLEGIGQDEGDRLLPLIQLLRNHPDCLEAWRLLGRFADALGRPEIALRAAELEPWLPSESALRQARLLRARLAFDLERYERLFAELATLNAFDLEAELLRAQADLRLGNLRSASSRLQSLAIDHEEDPQVWLNLALLAADLDRAEGSQPGQPSSGFAAALVRSCVERIEEAVQSGAQLPPRWQLAIDVLRHDYPAE